MDATILQDPGECRLQQSAFEGLFVKGLKVEGAFANELRQAGFDVSAQQPSYPTTVFKQCVEVACRKVHPTRPTPEAMRLIGAKFVDGFLDTIVGRAVGVVLPFLSAETFLKRYPRFYAMAAPGVKMTLTEQSARNWQVVLRDRGAMADFNAGILICLLKRLGVQAEAQVVEQSKWHFVLSLKW